jgi:hypothetical protein
MSLLKSLKHLLIAVFSDPHLQLFLHVSAEIRAVSSISICSFAVVSAVIAEAFVNSCILKTICVVLADVSAEIRAVLAASPSVL